MSWFKRDKPATGPTQIEVGERHVRTEGLWYKCEGCRQIIWKKDFDTNWNVCPKCGTHSRIDAATRLRLLFDRGEYEQFDSGLASSDPLGFVDSKPYRERLESMRQATQLSDALISAAGKLDGRPVHICAMEPRFIGGVTASYAMLGDLNIAEPGALIGFAGPRVIEQTIRQKLPEGFQRSEFLLKHGMLDAVVPRLELKPFIARALRFFLG